MKLIGLISGGKDSVFNLLHCVANGHEIVALANLYPSQGKGDELDSFMYQTVGYKLVPAVAECMSLPLVRRNIERKSVSIDHLYDKNDSDEVEDLYLLLKDVLSSFPDVRGVSVGAVLSNYQRIRVENVCSRLGLQVFAYLWRIDQLELLHDMNQCGLQAILVKVATLGLESIHVGMKLCDMNELLRKLHSKWGIHPAGEGGEYETITLDSPLFKKKIIIENFDVVKSADHVCQVSFLTNARFSLEDKSAKVYEAELAEALNYLRCKYVDNQPSVINVQRTSKAKFNPDLNMDLLNVNSHSDKFITITAKFKCVDISDIDNIFMKIGEELCANDMSFSNAVMVNIVLHDIDLFSAFNTIYMKYFGFDHPAARTCIADFLDCVRIEIIACREKHQPALHVQSISYWAPANIGPYSQAKKIATNETDERYFIAGQIGLIPGSMKLPSDIVREVDLSICHVNSVVNAINDNSTSSEYSNYLENRVSLSVAICFFTNVDAYDNAVRLSGEKFPKDTPFLFVQVNNLPRDAGIEWFVSPVRHMTQEAYAVKEVSDDGTLIINTGLSLIMCSNDLDIISELLSSTENYMTIHFFATIPESIKSRDQFHCIVAEKILDTKGSGYKFAIVALK